VGAAVPEASTASAARDDGHVAAGGSSAGACDTLYYDGQCPLCAAEIKSLAEARGESLRLVDIHEHSLRERGTAAAGAASPVGTEPDAPPSTQSAAEPADPGPGAATPTVDELLRTLHLQRADGTWLTGADANVAAWEETERGRLLRVLRWPVLRPFVDLGYRIWAFWRYRRLYGRQFDAERHAPRSPGH